MKSTQSREERRDAKAGKTWLAHTCGFCGTRGGAYLSHYGVMRCSCGHFFWALQPVRDGKLHLFPHPGFHAKEAA